VADKDIKNSEKFTAVEISWQNMPTMPVMTPSTEANPPAEPSVPPVQ